LCDDEGIGARSPGDELAAPPAKEEAALIRFSFGRFCIHCSTDVSFWPKQTSNPQARPGPTQHLVIELLQPRAPAVRTQQLPALFIVAQINLSAMLL
jgi:hypothetical protein